jgi:hypothetical protein
VAWNTRPPARGGVRPLRQARYLTQSLFLASRAGARAFVWEGLRDRATYIAGVPSIASGLYFSPRRPKPALRAFRFPFLVQGRGRRRLAWGIAPSRRRSGIGIQLRRHGRWGTVGRGRSRSGGEFRISLRTGAGLYRAVQGGRRSRPWRG